MANNRRLWFFECAAMDSFCVLPPCRQLNLWGQAASAVPSPPPWNKQAGHIRERVQQTDFAAGHRWLILSWSDEFLVCTSAATRQDYLSFFRGEVVMLIVASSPRRTFQKLAAPWKSYLNSNSEKTQSLRMLQQSTSSFCSKRAETCVLRINGCTETNPTKKLFQYDSNTNE